MPTILTHPAVPLALRLGLGRKAVPKRLLIAGVVASIVPDFDVAAFRLGIPYAAEWGHRGVSHSLAFALLLAVIGACLARPLRTASKRAFWFLFISTASHGVLDAFTNGGLGIAFLWPISPERFFMPWHPIEVAPLGIARFLSQRGIEVMRSELVWIWVPCLGLALLVLVVRRLRGLTRC
ncbi:metal-dependent hydrolase [Methylomonas sp. MgM2]